MAFSSPALGVCALLSLCVVASSITTPYLLYSTGNTIRRMKPDGSNPTMLVGNAQGAHALDYHFGSNKLFWTSPAYDRVYQANLGDGLDLTEIITGFTEPRALAVNQANNMLYFSYKEVSGSTTTYRVASYAFLGVDPTPTPIGPLDHTVPYEAIAVATGKLYLTAGDTIFEYSPMSGNTVIITSNDVFALAVHGTKLYWIDRDDSINMQTIRSLDLPPATPPTTQDIRSGEIDAKYGVDVDGTTVFWTAEARVFSAPISSPTTPGELLRHMPSYDGKLFKGIKVVNYS